MGSSFVILQCIATASARQFQIVGNTARSKANTCNQPPKIFCPSKSRRRTAGVSVNWLVAASAKILKRCGIAAKARVATWKSSRPVALPIILETPVEVTTSQRNDRVGPASGFGYARAGEPVLTAELRVSHTFGIVLKVVCLAVVGYRLRARSPRCWRASWRSPICIAPGLLNIFDSLPREYFYSM